MNKKITSIARPNIALIKYWGKRQEELNLPDVGSVSITLDGIETKTTVQFAKDNDIFYLNGEKSNEQEHNKISTFLDIFRNLIGEKNYFEVHTWNNFPTSAGLASSASGFASLTKAVDELLNLNLPLQELSKIARMGSGSAARSIYGGFVEMHKGNQEDGSDSFAEQIADNEHLPLIVNILITNLEYKKVTSRDGMKLSKDTSPYYKEWVSSSEKDIKLMKQAIAKKDFREIGDLSIRSCMKMHSVMFTSAPPLMYWNATTFDIIKRIEELFYYKNEPVFFTIDAGPQVKVITTSEYQKNLLKIIKKINNIREHYVLTLGSGAEIV
jgi:diphosphomevalonate decarboxylase